MKVGRIFTKNINLYIFILGVFSKTGKTRVSHRVKMMTRWPRHKRWPKWPIDPVTQWPSSMSALQSDGWNRFVAGRATCSEDDQVGDATCGQEVGWVIRWCAAEEPRLPVWRRQVEPRAHNHNYTMPTINYLWVFYLIRNIYSITISQSAIIIITLSPRTQ